MKWVTRERPKIDRIACPWLISRFIDRDAEFLYVPAADVLRVAGETGAVRGALHPVMAEGPARVVVVNRTVEKARRVVEEFGAEPRLAWCGYADLGDERFDIVVDGTSASLRGELPPIPPRVFERGATAYEMVYGKGLTPFLRLAREAGVTRLADGVGMLVEQAAEAFAWWRGVRPATRPVIERLTVPLD